jgi:hypothetical protein
MRLAGGANMPGEIITILCEERELILSPVAASDDIGVPSFSAL